MFKGSANNNYRHGYACKGAIAPEYRVWYAMKQRCYNERALDYARYGGIGVTVDPDWMDFTNFIADMGPRPTSKHTLERINSGLGYSKVNCVWATYTEQNRNKPTYNKLTKQTADDIRKLFATGKYRLVDLARRYNVTANHIGHVVKYKVWK